MVPNDTSDTHIEANVGKPAACPRCGGWTTFGGMSHKAQCTSPAVCQDRQDKLAKQNGPDTLVDLWPAWTN